MTEILLIDATEELQPLATELERAGFRVTPCPLAEARARLGGGERIDVLVVNLMGGPEAEGLLREASVTARTAVLAVLAVLGRQEAGLLDLDLAVDDFILVPAAQDEAAARVRRAVRRRAGAQGEHLIRCGDLTIDQASYRVFVANRPVDLTYKEYELLRFLALNQDKVCTRETLLSRVWGYDFYGGARTVDVHIRRLRSKIEDREHTLIETVRNVGYRLRAG
jgi:DNA-binding response OmpR family regulator